MVRVSKRKTLKRRKRYRGGGVQSTISGFFGDAKRVNEKNRMNNHVLPVEISLIKYLLDLFWGRKARPGAGGHGIYPIPYPGQLFKKEGGRQGSLQETYVCIQSCISEFEPTEPAPDKVGDDGKNTVANLVVDGSLSYNSIRQFGKGVPFEIYKQLITDYKKDGKSVNDYNSNGSHFPDMYENISKEVSRRKWTSQLLAPISNATTIWGIPLIKMKYITKEEFKTNAETYKKRYSVTNYEGYHKKYQESIEIKGFKIGELEMEHGNRKSLGERLRDNLEYKMDSSQEDWAYARFGILDLKDSNHLVDNLSTTSHLKNKVVSKKKQTKEQYNTSPGVDNEDEVDPDRTEGDEEKEEEKDEEKEEDKEDKGEKDKGKKEEEDGDPDGLRKIVETIYKYMDCSKPETLEGSLSSEQKDKQKAAMKVFDTCKIDNNGEMSLYVSNFLKNVLELDGETEGLEAKIREKVVGLNGKIFINKTNILIIKDYKVTIRNAATVRSWPPDTNLPEKLYYSKENKWNGKKKWKSDLLPKDEKTIPIKYTILQIKPKISSNKVVYISWSEAEIISDFKNNKISNSIPWLSITRKLGDKGLPDYLFINTLNGKGINTRSGGGGKTARIARKWQRSAPTQFAKWNPFSQLSKDRKSSNVVDFGAIKKNWNYKIGDVLLWLGNGHLYIKRKLGAIGANRRDGKSAQELWPQNRKSTYLDSNTYHRLPTYKSYCIIVGYGVDVLYSSPGSEAKQENIEKIVDYGHNYKHNNLLSGEGSKSLLSGPYEDEISSRLLHSETSKPGNPLYRWNLYDEDDFMDVDGKVGPQKANLDGDGDTDPTKTPDQFAEKSDYQRRRTTPNKRCYYIVESKIKINEPSRLCKVYVDEADTWGVNSTRFTRKHKVDGPLARDTDETEIMYSDTQAYNEDKFKEAITKYGQFPKSQKSHRGGSPPPKKNKTKGDDVEESDGVEESAAEQNCNENEFAEGEDIREYPNEDDEVAADHLLKMDKLPFLRSLPCSLYNYLAYSYFRTKNVDDTLDHMKKFLKCNKEEIWYRYPQNVQKYEKYNTLYFFARQLAPYLEDEENAIPKIYNNFEKYEFASQTTPRGKVVFQQTSQFDDLFSKIVTTSDRYTLEKTPAENIPGPIIISEQTELCNLFPKVKGVLEDNKERHITKYIDDLKSKSGLDIKGIKDLSNYGIMIDEWADENKGFLTPYIATDRKSYMGFPALVNILNQGDSLSIYSFGYYRFLETPVSGEIKTKQSLEWIDRHVPLKDYKLDGAGDKPPKDRLKRWNDTLRKKVGDDGDDAVVHSPILIICENGKYYIPPICFNMNPGTESYIRKKFKIKIERRSKTTRGGDELDVRTYCHEFLEQWKKGTLLIIDNIDLIECLSGKGNPTKPYNLTYDDTTLFSQYNSKRFVLPMDNIGGFDLDKGFKRTINDLRNMESGVSSDTVKFSDSKDGLGEIFGLKVFTSSLAAGDSDDEFLYYDYWQMNSILNMITKDTAKIGYMKKSETKMKELARKLPRTQDMHIYAKFNGTNLFFIDEKGTKFFKYLFLKYKYDMKLFSEPMLDPKPEGPRTGALYNSLFYGWGTTAKPSTRSGTPLMLNRNAVARLSKSGDLLYKIYGGARDAGLADGGSLRKKYNDIINILTTTDYLERMGEGEEVIKGVRDLLSSVADIMREVTEVRAGASGGGKRTNKKRKNNMNLRTLKRNRRKQTNKKIRHQKRVTKRLTKKKRNYNP